MSEQLENIYRDYIAALNDRRLDDLDRFVHDRLTYNGEEWTRDQYQAPLADDLQKIPDLHYEIRHRCGWSQSFVRRARVLPLSREPDRKRVVFDRYRRHTASVVDAGETVKAGILRKPGSAY